MVVMQFLQTFYLTSWQLDGLMATLLMFAVWLLVRSWVVLSHSIANGRYRSHNRPGPGSFNYGPSKNLYTI